MPCIWKRCIKDYFILLHEPEKIHCLLHKSLSTQDFLNYDCKDFLKAFIIFIAKATSKNSSDVAFLLLKIHQICQLTQRLSEMMYKRCLSAILALTSSGRSIFHQRVAEFHVLCYTVHEISASFLFALCHRSTMSDWFSNLILWLHFQD